MFENLGQINKEKALHQAEQNKHTENQLANIQLQETVVKSFKALVDFLENRTSKTLVLNQLKEVGTPDALKVVAALEAMHETLKTHENTDLSEITRVMREQLEEIKKIPKEHPDAPEPIDQTEQFKSLEETLDRVVEAIKAQELNVEAPVINLPPPKVTVPKPEVKVVKETTEVTNEITVTDWRKEYVFSDSRKSEKVSYYGYLKTDGSWYIMRHRQSAEDEDDMSDDWDEIRYVFGTSDYSKAFRTREKLKYAYLNEARDE